MQVLLYEMWILIDKRKTHIFRNVCFFEFFNFIYFCFSNTPTAILPASAGPIESSNFLLTMLI